MATVIEFGKSVLNWVFNPGGGLVVVIVGALITAYFSKGVRVSHSEDSKQSSSGPGLLIEQTAAGQMRNTTGLDIESAAGPIDLPQTTIRQSAESMHGVTGMKISANAMSGEIRVREKVEIEQNFGGGTARIQINGHLPGVDVRFNKKGD